MAAAASPVRGKTPSRDELEAAHGCQQRGNAHFADQNFVAAKKEYTIGLRLLEAIEDPDAALTAEILSTRVVLLTNRAICQKQTHHFEAGLDDVTAALAIAPERAKVHAVRGTLLIETECYGDAVAAFETAARLEPSLPEIEAKVQQARALLVSYGPNPLVHRVLRAESQLVGAAVDGDVSKMAAALERGASIDARAASVDPSCATALILGAQAGSLPVVAFALAHGAAVDAVDNHGRSALWHAAQADCESVASALLAAGANASLIDHSGASPRDVAEARLAVDGHSEVICVLDDAAATPGATASAVAAKRAAEESSDDRAARVGSWLTAGVLVVSVAVLFGLHFTRR